MNITLNPFDSIDNATSDRFAFDGNASPVNESTGSPSTSTKNEYDNKNTEAPAFPSCSFSPPSVHSNSLKVWSNNE